MGACISIPSILEDTYTLRCIKDESEFEIIKNNDKIHFIYEVVGNKTNLLQILFYRGEDKLFVITEVNHNDLPKNNYVLTHFNTITSIENNDAVLKKFIDECFLLFPKETTKVYAIKGGKRRRRRRTNKKKNKNKRNTFKRRTSFRRK